MDNDFIKNILIRESTNEDIKHINEITNFCIENTTYNLNTKTKTLEETTIWFNSHNKSNYPIFSAIYNNNLIGWASLSRFRDLSGYNKTVEVSVYVNNNFYKKGIGKILLETLERKAVKIGYHVLISIVTLKNEPSIFLHRKCGFEIKGTMKEIAFKNNEYLDVVFMTKILK